MGTDVVERVKHAGGRPTKYDEQYAKQAYKYCLLGADDMRLAELFEVSESTVNNWKLEHPEFLDSIKMGRDVADANVGKSLYDRAMGYSHPEDKIFVHNGETIIVPTTKHYPPDATSAIFWLKNRQPAKWRDTQNIEVSGPNGSPIQVQQLATMSEGDLRQLIEILERNQIQGEVVDITPDE
jgi:hypothetical protein